MKKENRKLAQEKRAEERKQKEQAAKTKKYLSIGLPIALIAVLILLILTNPFSSFTDAKDHSSHDHATSEESNESLTTDDETQTSLQTDASLTVEDGDTVNIDYVGSVDGVEFAGGNTQGYGTDLVIGSHSYIDDFEQQLIGAHPGDTVNVVVTFPENYGVDELNGKEAVFVTTINGIYR